MEFSPRALTGTVPTGRGFPPARESTERRLAESSKVVFVAITTGFHLMALPDWYPQRRARLQARELGMTR